MSRAHKHIRRHNTTEQVHGHGLLEFEGLMVVVWYFEGHQARTGPQLGCLTDDLLHQLL